MAGTLVSTTNTERIWSAFDELSQRLTDPEILGFGVIYGDPGRGKTCTCETIYAQSQRDGDVECYFVSARSTWRPASMLRGMLRAMGTDARERCADDLLTRILDDLQRRPGIFIIDEMKRFIGDYQMAEILKQIHDETRCAFMLVGEERSMAILRSHQSHKSLLSRLNMAAVVEVQDHSLADVAAVIESRCDFGVDPDVVEAIHRANSQCMRLVVRECRQMRVMAETNGLDRITTRDYRAIRDAEARRAVAVEGCPALAAVGGAHG